MTPEEAHHIYLDTAQKLGWPIRPEVNVPYDKLSVEAKALDIAFSDACNKEILEEREECAKVAEEKKNFLVSVNDGIVTIPNLAGQIAKEIRARSGEKVRLKEKLAKEWRETSTERKDYPEGADTLTYSSAAFIAGFEKAREMAQEKLNRFTFQQGLVSGLVLGEKSTTILQEFGLGEILKDIGEEEVS